MKRGWIVVPIALLAVACGSDDSSSEDAVEKAAQEQADRYTSGDYGGAWDMWTDDAKEAFSRDDYIALNEACGTAGAPLEVSSVRINGDGATVRLALGDFEQAYSMKFEDGEWRWQPTEENMDRYALGVDAAIADEKAEGLCD